MRVLPMPLRSAYDDLPAPCARCLSQICNEMDNGCNRVMAYELEVTKVHQDKIVEKSEGESHEVPPLSQAEEDSWLAEFQAYPFVFVQSLDTGLFVDYVMHRDEPM